MPPLRVSAQLKRATKSGRKYGNKPDNPTTPPDLSTLRSAAKKIGRSPSNAAQPATSQLAVIFGRDASSVGAFDVCQREEGRGRAEVRSQRPLKVKREEEEFCTRILYAEQPHTVRERVRVKRNGTRGPNTPRRESLLAR